MNESNESPDPLVAPVVGGTPLSVDEFRREVRDKLNVARRTSSANVQQQCEDFLVEQYAAALVPRPEPREPEPEYSPEAIAELRREFEAWIAKRDVPPEVLALVMPWKDAAVRPASAPSLEPQVYDFGDGDAFGRGDYIAKADYDERIAELKAASAPSLEPTFPKGHPALCYELCDPTFEVTPHIHTSMGVYIVEVEP